MSDMNFKDFPVVEVQEFETVIIDATLWKDGMYSAHFNFFKQFSEDEVSGAEGFALLTRVCGESLAELYDKIVLLIMSGIFDGVEICSHGTVYDEDYIEIEPVCWNSFAEEDPEVTTAPAYLH